VAVDSAGRVLDFGAVRFLHPEDVVFTQMLTGWRNQQLSRNLSFGTIEGRERLVTRFQESTNEYPWQWTPAHVDEFFGDLRSVKHAAQSTIRSYQAALRAFCSYVASPDYGWDRVCEQYFGTHPSQVCFDWNTAVHAQTNESDPKRRPFTRQELQAFFDRADDEVDQPSSIRQRPLWPANSSSVKQ
tara:strand:- start:204 stop:761 length:558 start_codon:yes stop_codon:yes gene_type:complete